MGRTDHLLARRSFEEMQSLERIIEDLGKEARVEVIDHVEHKGLRFPLHSIEIGNPDPTTPVLAFFGGVHGLEKIGSEVILSYMELVTELLRWDKEFRARLETSRLLFMPIVNPVGIVLRRRANGNGVDLMRNSPVEAEGEAFHPIFSGHRISNHLPWFRGVEGQEMECEAKAMMKVVKERLYPSKLSVAVDIHSGFGMRDRFWFPYAFSKTPYPYLAEVAAMKGLFDKTYPHHFYIIEPVCRSYMIHGDLWDWMVQRHELEKQGGRTQGHFFPWTLEMGSWLWLRKNPRQIFNPFGLFHPMQPHRHHRIMRRHITLFDFLHRSILFPEAWLHPSHEERRLLEKAAMEKWYA